MTFELLGLLASEEDASRQSSRLKVPRGSIVTLEVKGDDRDAITLDLTSEDPTLSPKRESTSGVHTLGSLSEISAKAGSRISLEVREDRRQTLTIRVRGERSEVLLSVSHPFQLVAGEN